jgi:arylsulfatase A-like enzyme
LLEKGIFLSDYYTFKICSPSRAAMITGRYPWGAGFYDMSMDDNHCTTNSTALPELLKPLGYKTHALGKPFLHEALRTLHFLCEAQCCDDALFRFVQASGM